DLADQLHELADGATGLARVHLEDRRFLLRRDSLVEIDRGSPVAFQDVARHARDQRNRAVGNVDPIDRSLVEAPGDDRVAGPEVGVRPDQARAKNAAVAHFEQATFEVISHKCLLGISKRKGAGAGDSPIARRTPHPTPTPVAMPYDSCGETS